MTQTQEIPTLAQQFAKVAQDVKRAFLLHTVSGNIPELEKVLRLLRDERTAGLLKAHGVHINMKLVDGWCALMHAVAHDKPDVVKLLVNEPGIDVNQKDSDGWTALHLAGKTSKETTQALLSARNNIDLNVRDNNGRTPLMAAVCEGKMDVLEELLAVETIDVIAKDIHGNTALDWAERFRHPEAKSLIENYKALQNERKLSDALAALEAAGFSRAPQ